MPRALRSLPLLMAVLVLVAAMATTASAREPRQPRLQDMTSQQFQAQGNGVVTLDGGFSVIGWVQTSRRASIRVVDRAGDAKLTVNGREITFRRRQARVPGGGRYLVTGTRFTLEIRGAQGLEASGVGWARFQGRGQYSVADGDSGSWNGPRVLIGIPPKAGGEDDDDRDRVRGLGEPEIAPQPVTEPAAATSGPIG